MTPRPGVGLAYAEVIGDPVAHSKSPAIHLFWMKRAGLAGDFRATRVAPADLATFLAGRRGDPDWLGCSVTLPHKQLILPLLDRVDPAAGAIGAVNIVRAEAGELVGYNSDWSGFLEPIAPLLDQRHLFRMARVLGAGGGARAIVHALKRHGFMIVVLARDVEKARGLLENLGEDPALAADLATFAKPSDFAWDDRDGVLDLFVNATPLGMAGQPPLAVHPSHIPPGAVVYDIVYDPLATPLLADARAAGLATIDGLGMLIAQAGAAFRLLFGHPAPRDHDTELRALLTS